MDTRDAVSMRFLLPHLPEFEGDIQDLLFEIDKLVEKKKCEWENQLNTLEKKLLIKVKENQSLQETISVKELELNSAFSKLNEIESKLQNGEEKQLDNLKATVQWVTENYEVMQRKYRKQISTEKERNSRIFTKLEGDNTALITELKTLQADTRTRVERLTDELETEKECNAILQERCTNLIHQLDTSNIALVEEKQKHDVLDSKLRSRQEEFDDVLQNINHTTDIQAKELTRMRQHLNTKQAELRRLSSDALVKQSELIASRETVRRLEIAVNRHLSVVSNSDSHTLSCTSPTSSFTQTPDYMDCEEVTRRLSQLEEKLNDTHQILIFKMQEFSRLETACHTASSTIHRLVEVKTHALEQTASLGFILGKSSVVAKSINERLCTFHQEIQTKLSATESKVKNLQRLLLRFQIMNSEGNSRRSVQSVATQAEVSLPISRAASEGVQTDEELMLTDYWHDSRVQRLRKDWMSSMKKVQQTNCALTEELSDSHTRLSHQTSFVERLQKENLALTDLLTNAEEFNRTGTECIAHIPNFSTSINEHKTTRSSAPSLAFDSGQASARSITIESPVNMKPVSQMSPTSVDMSRWELSSGIESCEPNFGMSSSDHAYFEEERDTLMPTKDASRSCLPLKLPHSLVPSQRSFERSVRFSIQHDGSIKDIPETNAFDTSGTYVSPSEYGDFVLSAPRSTSQLVGSVHNTISETCTATKNRVPPMSSDTADWLNKVDLNETNLMSTPTQRCAMEFEYETNTRKSTRSPNDPPLLYPYDGESFDQLKSNAETDSNFTLQADSEDEEEEDTSVYCLAAKFLANEQHHSLQLERQIDIHLDTLKKQIGI